MIRDRGFISVAAIVSVVAAAMPGAGTAQPPAALNMRAMWHEPAGAGTPNCEGRDDNVQRQLGCVVKLMKASGATPRAIGFARRCQVLFGEICFISNLQPFGPLALATIALPFRRNTNAHTDSEYAIANGAPDFIRVDDRDALQTALASNPAWLRLIRKHSNIDVWEGTAFSGAHAMPDGGWRFLFSYPLGTYHAEAGRWNASVAFDFAPGGRFAGRKLLAITGPRQ